MDTKKLIHTAGTFGLKVGFLKKSIYKSIAMDIPDSAGIEYMAEGLEGANAVPIVVTTDMLYATAYTSMVGGMKSIRVKRAQITDISMTGTLLKTLRVATAGTTYELKGIRPDQARYLVDKLLDANILPT